MRFLVLASVLLLAVAATAQQTPRPYTQNAPLSVGSSSTCLSIVRIPARNVEKLGLRAFTPGPVTNCTPANHFRAEYIPNAVQHRESLPAVCPDCTVDPAIKEPRVQPVNVPK